MPNDTDLIEWPAGNRGARVLGATPQAHASRAAVWLAPLELLYRAGVAARNFAYQAHVLPIHHATIPVISVGNIVAGGAGKTPFTRWLVQHIAAHGRKVAILHGGYGSDEPELHRRWHDAALVFEQRDRTKAAAQAAAAGADVIVLDDAFQHRRLARDLDIVLVPAESESQHMLPRGPLREGPGALARADLIVVTRKTAAPEAAARLAADLGGRHDKHTAVAAILPDRMRAARAGDATPPARVMIVSAIARPDLLRAQVRAHGIEVARMLAYPDHFQFTAGDVRQIHNAAGALPILTTEKDIVKLAPLMNENDVWVLEQHVRIEQGQSTIDAGLAGLGVIA